VPDKAKVNGDDILLHYGDTIETLPHRLNRLEREVRVVRAGILAAVILLILHILGVQGAALFPFLARLLGL